MTPSPKQVRREASAVGLVVIALLLLLTGREPPWGDAQVMYEVAESIVLNHHVTVGLDFPPQSHRGPDGQLYAQYALMPSLSHVPGVVLRQALTRVAPDDWMMARVVTSHVAPAFGLALAAALGFAFARRRGASRRSSLFGVAILVCATQLFVHARYPMSEALQAGAFTGFVIALIRIADGARTRRAGIALGVWAGLVVNTKAVLLLGVAVGLCALLALLWRQRRELAPVVLGLAIGALPMVAIFAAYNYARWGNPLDTGYSETLGNMGEAVWVGLMGLFVSPGKGLLWFSPAVVLGGIALWRAWRTEKPAVILIAACVVPIVIFYACFLSWSGDYAWGPRYLSFGIPAVMLLVPPWLDRLHGRRVARSAVYFVFVVGICVQVLGSAVFCNHWIRLSRAARIQWLGNPNRAGAPVAEAGRGHCDWCFEDMFGHQWLPAFSQIAGHAWMVRHIAMADDWPTAEADAPWRRYTSLDLTEARTFYSRLRFDSWLIDAGRGKTVTAIWLVLLALVGAAGVWLWRRPRGPPT